MPDKELDKDQTVEPEVTEAGTSAGGYQSYLFPDEGVVIKARTMDEAISKLEKQQAGKDRSK